jgi:hypothetical protein
MSNKLNIKIYKPSYVSIFSSTPDEFIPILKIDEIINTKQSYNTYLHPKEYQTSYSTWEFVYFEHLLNLFKIFMDEISEFKINKKNIFSLFYKFSKMIFLSSNGKISPYINKLSIDLEKMYSKYLIKREEDNI